MAINDFSFLLRLFDNIMRCQGPKTNAIFVLNCNDGSKHINDILPANTQ